MVMNYQIRTLLRSELEFLKDMLFEAIYLPPEQKMDLSRDILKHPDIARYYENWGRKGDIALVAATEGNQPTLFGCVWGRLFSPGKRVSP